MRLLWLSLAPAIIYIMAIVRAPRVEARATTTSSTISEESSSSSISLENFEIPAKPATPEQTVEAFALGMPTVLAGVYWTELAFQTMYNNSMNIASKMKDDPDMAEAVAAYMNKTLTW